MAAYRIKLGAARKHHESKANIPAILNLVAVLVVTVGTIFYLHHRRKRSRAVGHPHDLNVRRLPSDWFATHNTECIICMSSYPWYCHKEVVQMHGCDHAFHAHCIVTWVNTQLAPSIGGPRHGTCPTCRNVIFWNPLIPLVARVMVAAPLRLTPEQLRRVAQVNDDIGAGLRDLMEVRAELRGERDADGGRWAVEIDALSEVRAALSDVRRGLTGIEERARR